MDTGLVLIHFGEPPTPDRSDVERYLTRIFLQNADLEEYDSREDARERAETLARRRTPGLVEEYEEIGGSPLNAQAAAQADALAGVLADRGYAPRIALAFQFFEPTIQDVLAEMRTAGVDRLVVLPVYPLCGPSTTVAALERVDEVLAERDWDPEVTQLSGWHRHPRYLRMRADNLAGSVTSTEVDLGAPGTVLLFSAHGTHMKYIEDGSRYVDYVEESASTLAAMVDAREYAIGYQNHENRDIPWTEPDIEETLAGLDADTVVVEPMSFMHEQSETLSELDDDLAGLAAEQGLDFHRVPIPHDHDPFPALLADLVEPSLAGFEHSMVGLGPCRCKPDAGTYCLNAGD